MTGVQTCALPILGVSGPADVGKQGEVIRKGFEKTLANMKELAEMAQHAQSEAMARITQRATHQMQEIKAMVRPK